MQNETNKTTCTGFCGMNYCDENGCIDRKRNLVEGPEDPFTMPQKQFIEEFDFDLSEDQHMRRMFWGLFIVFAVFALLTLLSYVISKQP